LPGIGNHNTSIADGDAEGSSSPWRDDAGHFKSARQFHLRPSAGGTIAIDVSDCDTGPQGVCFSVRDNGEGISPEALPRVFDAFFTTRATVGTGIGLFVAKQLIEGHGGRIAIESSKELKEHGTAVHIFLPSAAPSEVQKSLN
jgi:signal transduction histidine kinase